MYIGTPLPNPSGNTGVMVCMFMYVMLLLKIVKVEMDKKIKYLDLAREAVDLLDVDSAIVVPIVVTANGLIAKSLDQHLRRLWLGGWIKGLIQQAVLLDTARIVGRFLSQDL